LLYMIYRAMSWLHPKTPPDGTLLTIAICIVTIYPILVLVYKGSYETQRWRNSDYSPYSQS